MHPTITVVYLKSGAVPAPGVISGMRDKKNHINNTKPGDPGWLGNEHKAKDAGGTLTREQAIQKYRDDFNRHLKDPDFVTALEGIRGKEIGYYKPTLPSHLDVVREYLLKTPPATVDKKSTVQDTRTGVEIETRGVQKHLRNQVTGTSISTSDMMKRGIRTAITSIKELGRPGSQFVRDGVTYEITSVRKLEDIGGGKISWMKWSVGEGIDPVYAQEKFANNIRPGMFQTRFVRINKPTN